LPVRTIVVIGMAEHTVCEAGVATAFGVGLTVIVKVIGIPKHPFAVGVTVIKAITGATPILVAVNEGMFPDPLAANPMDGSLFVQSNVTPPGVPVRGIGKVVAPLQ
jgi:hypothetical protein